MIEIGQPAVADINDPSQLPGIGVFPVTIDDRPHRVTTSLAYLTSEVRARANLTIRTNAEVATLVLDGGRIIGVTLVSGEELEADEVVVAAGALWSPTLLLRSGIGPADHLADHEIAVHANLPVGATMSDHLGPGIPYRHEGPRGGIAGPAQVLLVGASNGTDIAQGDDLVQRSVEGDREALAQLLEFVGPRVRGGLSITGGTNSVTGVTFREGSSSPRPIRPINTSRSASWADRPSSLPTAR